MGEFTYCHDCGASVLIPPDATALRGITDADVVDAQAIADLLPQLSGLMAGKPVTSYNLAFDLRILRQSIAAVGLEGPVDWHPPAECLMEMYAEWWGNWSDHHGSYTGSRWVRPSTSVDSTSTASCTGPWPTPR